MKFITQIILLLVIVSVSCKSFQRLRAKFNLKHKRISAKKNPTIYSIQKGLNDLEEQNIPASRSFVADPQGQKDSFFDARTDNLWVKVTSKSLAAEVAKSEQTENEIEQKLVTLNAHQLYIFENADIERSYRGTAVGLSLSDIVTSSDDLTQNECCRRISPVFKDEELHCISVEGNDNQWQICSDIVEEIHSFRSELVLRSLAAQNVFYENPFFLREAAEIDYSNWSWNDQNDWQGECTVGQNQSPVQIVPEHATDRDMEFQWHYGHNEHEYPTANYDGHEINIEGNFGHFVFIQHTTVAESAKHDDYYAKKIVIKSRPEHQITPDVSAEIQVHHQSKDGNVAIVSFLLQVDNELEHPNVFVDALKPDLWELEEGFEIKLDDFINLNDIVIGGAKQYFNKSFFLYVGSESTPPCQEGVFRIIFNTPIKVQESQLEAIQRNTVDRDVEVQGNARRESPLGKRQVFYNADKNSECAGLYQFPFDTRNHVDVDDQIEQDGGSIKSTDQQNIHYEFVKDLPVVEQIGKHFNVQEVAPEDLEQDLLDDLLDGQKVDANEVQQDELNQLKRKHRKFNRH